MPRATNSALTRNTSIIPKAPTPSQGLGMLKTLCSSSEPRKTQGSLNGARSTEAEKDPYTLEREARNKERLEREKQHREKTKSGRRRDSRQDRVVGGRRIHYKYEDEL
ncbi:hypothetical protein N7461_004288 [Penicillium sp. DV-2018c]|nr:hypothetical protein N7461_004288 [Penicillium sp. DV-2018c]